MDAILLVKAAQQEVLQELLQNESIQGQTIEKSSVSHEVNNLVIQAAKVREIDLNLTQTGRGVFGGKV